MKIQISFDAQEYRRKGATPAQIARRLESDVQRKLRPMLRTISQVIWTGDMHVDGDFLEARLGAAEEEDWRTCYERIAAAVDRQLACEWERIYAAVLNGVRLPVGLTQDAVIEAMREILADVQSGWVSAEHVWTRLNKIDKLCTLYGCLEYYDQIAALLVEQLAQRQAHARQRKQDLIDDEKATILESEDDE